MLEKYRLTDEQIEELLKDVPPNQAKAYIIANAQLEAVKPAIEEAEKEERERIGQWLELHYLHDTGWRSRILLAIDKLNLGQALKNSE